MLKFNAVVSSFPEVAIGKDKGLSEQRPWTHIEGGAQSGQDFQTDGEGDVHPTARPKRYYWHEIHYAPVIVSTWTGVVLVSVYTVLLSGLAGKNGCP